MAVVVERWLVVNRVWLLPFIGFPCGNIIASIESDRNGFKKYERQTAMRMKHWHNHHPPSSSSVKTNKKTNQFSISTHPEPSRRIQKWSGS